VWLAAIPASLAVAFLALAAYTFVPDRTPIPSQAFLPLMLTSAASLLLAWLVTRRLDMYGTFSGRVAEARRNLPRRARVVVLVLSWLVPVGFAAFFVLSVFGPLRSDQGCELHGGPFGTGCTVTVNGQQQPGTPREFAAARRLYDLALCAGGVEANTIAFAAVLGTAVARTKAKQPRR
jgi:hypothetical protein